MGVGNFSRAATPVPTNEPTRALVTTGIHGWTRNPIYLGMFLAYGGIGIAARSPWILVLMLPLALTIDPNWKVENYFVDFPDIAWPSMSSLCAVVDAWCRNFPPGATSSDKTFVFHPS